MALLVQRPFPDFTCAAVMPDGSIDDVFRLGQYLDGHIGVLGNLASLQWRRGDRATARATQQLAVDRATRLLPREHFVVSVSMTNLAWMACELGELDVAAGLLREALSRSEAAGRVGEAAMQRQRLDELLRRRAGAADAAGDSGR